MNSHTSKIVTAIILTTLAIGMSGCGDDTQTTEVEDTDVSDTTDAGDSSVNTDTPSDVADTPATDPADTIATPDSKTWEDENFSFTYPIAYTADEKGLWTEEGYQKHLNPPDLCSLCHIPYYQIQTEKTLKSLEEYIIEDFNLTGETLDQASNQDGVTYSRMTIGENDFIKITVEDFFTVTGYYTKNNNQVVAFRVYQNERDGNELKDIIATLKF
ncbi:MAG: hypothetical protein WC897_01700 [Candidatus Gracilibacteria bacterium]